MAEFPNHEPATKQDLTDLVRQMVEGNTELQVDLHQEVHHVRSEVRSELAHLGQMLRTELAQFRHELLVKLESASRRVEVTVTDRESRLTAVIIVSHLVALAIMAALFRWST